MVVEREGGDWRKWAVILAVTIGTGTAASFAWEGTKDYVRTAIQGHEKAWGHAGLDSLIKVTTTANARTEEKLDKMMERLVEVETNVVWIRSYMDLQASERRK